MAAPACASAPHLSTLFLSDAEYAHELDMEFATAQEYLDDAEQDYDEAEQSTHESIHHAHVEDNIQNIKPDEIRLKLQRDRDMAERVKNPEIEKQFKYKARTKQEASLSREYSVAISSMTCYEMELDAQAQAQEEERQERKREKDRQRKEKMKQIVSAPVSPRNHSIFVTRPASQSQSYHSNPTSPRFVAEQNLLVSPPTRLTVIANKASAAASKLNKLARKISDNISRKSSTPSTSTCNSPAHSPRSTPRVSIDPDIEHIPSSAIKGRTSSAAYRALMENSADKLEKERMSPRLSQQHDQTPKPRDNQQNCSSPKQFESPKPHIPSPPVPARPSSHSYSAYLNQIKSTPAPPPSVDEDDVPPPPPPEEEDG